VSSIYYITLKGWDGYGFCYNALYWVGVVQGTDDIQHTVLYNALFVKCSKAASKAKRPCLETIVIGATSDCLNSIENVFIHNTADFIFYFNISIYSSRDMLC